MGPEAVVERYFKDQARRHGALALKFVSASTSGVPDQVLIAKGHVTFVELKAPGKRMRSLQRSVTARMAESGADVRCLDTKEKIDEFMEEVDSWRWRKRPERASRPTSPTAWPGDDTTRRSR